MLVQHWTSECLVLFLCKYFVKNARYFISGRRFQTLLSVVGFQPQPIEVKIRAGVAARRA